MAAQFPPRWSFLRRDAFIASRSFDGARAYKFDVLWAQGWVVWSKGVLANGTVRSADLQTQARTGLGHALPCVSGMLGLLVGGEFVREAADDTGGIEALRGHHDGVEHVGRRNHQQRNRSALLFRNTSTAMDFMAKLQITPKA